MLTIVHCKINTFNLTLIMNQRFVELLVLTKATNHCHEFNTQNYEHNWNDIIIINISI